MVSPTSGKARVGTDFDGFFKGLQTGPRPLFDMFKLKPTWQQDELIDFLEYQQTIPLKSRQKRVGIVSGQGTGKTTSMCVITGFWRPMLTVDGFTVVTAPTSRQCREVFLGEARRLMLKAPRWFNNFVTIQHDRMYFGGRKTWGTLTATAQKDTSMQGFHAPLLTFYLEECSGISDEMVEQAKGTLTNPDSYLFAAGNPNLRTCAFYEFFYGVERSEWIKYHWDGEKSPIASKENQERLAREYGPESDVYRVRVRGLFPRGNPDAILDADALLQCFDDAKSVEEYRQIELPEARAQRQIGIDLARFGKDESVIAIREGSAIIALKPMYHYEPSDVLREAMRMQEKLGWTNEETSYVVDAGGLGQGAMSTLHEAGRKVLEFHNGSKKAPRDFENKITEGWFWLRKLVREGRIVLPKDRKLQRQLEGRTYKLADAEGKVKVRSKEEHAKDGEESPDRAEAVVYACYARATAEVRVAKGDRPRRQTREQYHLGSRLFRS